MTKTLQKDVQDATSVRSAAEDLFVQLFAEAFGPAQADKLFVQYPFVDIYGRHRAIDFALETEAAKIAIEIDGERYHNPRLIPDDKYADDLLRQNSLVYKEWKVYRWTYRQLRDTPERVKDELTTFLDGALVDIAPAYLPEQAGSALHFRDYQQDALAELAALRARGETITLLYHATGVGKTVTAAADAKRLGLRTLFLVNALKLADQARERFREVWPEATTGLFTGTRKDAPSDVLFATVQSVVKHLGDFPRDAFGYLILDECHHAASPSYARLLNHFRPAFTLGLTATPEREDGEDLLKTFRSVAHRMELSTAVQQGILAAVRCFRVKTNIDLSGVRVHGIAYDSLDLESKLFIPERNRLIVDTYLAYARGHRTVVFCASVRHAEEIRDLLRRADVRAEAVSGRQGATERRRILTDYEQGRTDVLCACDLLNEGWDSPQTDRLFMARPTMSKTVYLQQLGRGMRKCAGKTEVIVFDFVDNAGLFNAPYSLHRVLNIGQYRPFACVLAPAAQRAHEDELYRRAERPEALVDLPVFAMDYEPVDLFDWQEQAKDMISLREFVRRVDVQSETVERYLKDGRIQADLSVPVSPTRTFHYFRPATVERYAKAFGWDLIDAKNIKAKFLAFVRKMDMSYSYKPVLLLAMLDLMDDYGRANIDEVVAYFIDYYAARRRRGLAAEKPASPFARPEVSPAEAKRCILANPFRRFADMRFMSYSKDLERIEFNWDMLWTFSDAEYAELRRICEDRLSAYYAQRVQP